MGIAREKEEVLIVKQWYEKLFENYADHYDLEIFTQGTLGECDFIEKELHYDKSLSILDVGCGTGRHAIELTKRGYRVIGIDFSEAQLKKAIEKAKASGLEIPFLKHDARNLPFDKEFDVAIMLCEGAFPLMETDAMNFAILKSVTQSLKDSSKFIFTTLNGLYPLHHSIHDFHSTEQSKEGAHHISGTFDLMTFRDHNTTTYTDDAGVEHRVECSERYYVPSEISWLLQSLGYKTISVFGAKIGAYSRADKLTTEDYEMLVIAEK